MPDRFRHAVAIGFEAPLSGIRSLGLNAHIHKLQLTRSISTLFQSRGINFVTDYNHLINA